MHRRDLRRRHAARIAIAGRLSPFIELGVGFNMDLTARDNVVINAIMLGLSRQQARERFDDVIAFAELEEFVDLKLKNYSSGMLVRLAFATAIQVDAEILLIDEVLAVGDAAFQQKCFEEFFRLKREGRTIVFVSHDMDSVERFCDRAMLMEQRRDASRSATPHAIARAYHKLNFGKLPHDAPAAGRARAAGTAIADAWFENAAGERIAEVSQEEPLRMCFEVRFAEALDDPVFAATLRTELGHTIVVARSDERGAQERIVPRRRDRGGALRDAGLADAEPLPADALAGARRDRRRRGRAGRGHDLDRRPRRTRAAASSSCR